MGFDTALARLEEPGAAVLALPPGLLLDLPPFGLSVPLARVKPAPSGAGIDIPWPTMQVPAHDRTEATDGDRARQREGWPARGGGQDPPPRWRARGGEDRPRRPNGAAGGPVP